MKARAVEVVITVLCLVAAGAVAYFMLRPGPCDGVKCPEGTYPMEQGAGLFTSRCSCIGHPKDP